MPMKEPCLTCPWDWDRKRDPSNPICAECKYFPGKEKVKKTTRKRYFFVVCINGAGETKEEAWKDAIEHFSESPEDPPEEEDSSLLNKINDEKADTEHVSEIECYAVEEEEEI